MTQPIEQLQAHKLLNKHDNNNMNIDQNAMNSMATIVPGAEDLIFDNQLSVIQLAQTCRICLEQCNESAYCKCKGNMLTHKACLIQFLSLKGSTQQRCQICKQEYGLVYQTQQLITCKRLCQRIKQDTTRCGFYVMFYLVMLAYLTFYGVITSSSTGLSLKILTSILAACAIILLIVATIIWVYEYIIIRKVKISSIKTFKEKNISRVD